jgi:hypothetical protein
VQVARLLNAAAAPARAGVACLSSLRIAVLESNPTSDVFEVGAELLLTHLSNPFVGHEDAGRAHDVDVEPRVDPRLIAARDWKERVFAPWSI